MLVRKPREGDRIGSERATGTVVGLDGACVLVRLDGWPEGSPCYMLWECPDGSLVAHLALWD